MGDTYTKLFASITESTIWCEPSGTRLVWITLLAKCNRHGEVFGSVPGLARLANVSLEECESAIHTLLSPDKWSRTPDFEGRRITPIDGGWRILNHAKFDKLRSAIEAEERERERKRNWDRDHRPSGYARDGKSDESPTQSDESPTQSDESPTQSVRPPTPTPALEEQELFSTSKEVEGENSLSLSRCPVQKIINLYQQKLPTLPKVEKVTKSRVGMITQRWREDLPSLKHWENYFEDVSKSAFLMGRTQPTNGRPPFRADIDFLIKPANFAKIAEGKYHR
jgi:hypothetical protein